MGLAVIKTGGKQYLVAPGQKIKIEKIVKPVGEEVIFDEVLLLEKNKKVAVGTPLVNGSRVIGRVLAQDKAEKVIIFKYKAKTRHKVKRGHRQPFSELEILKIIS